MACRTLLLKLQAQGRIRLPPRRTASVNQWRHRRWPEVPHVQSPIRGELAALRPLRLDPLAAGDAQLLLFQGLLQRYHYLGLRNSVGQNLKYLVRDRTDRPLACLLFGSAAWQTEPRDRWIGWEAEPRRTHLHLLTNNSRFLILPWVVVPGLASHLLGQITARLSADWQHKYGHPIYLVETFVERSRFAATSYRAAGWRLLGPTTGRTRNDDGTGPRAPIKSLYVQVLRPDALRRLRA